MSSFPASLSGHLEGTVTTLCQCWRLTRRDGTVLGFTDHDLPLTIAGTLYEPQSGLSASEARASLGLAADRVDVAGALSSDGIGEEDIAAGLYDGATVETLLVNWREPEQFALLSTATVGRITLSDHRFVAELQGFAQALEATRGRTIRRSCDAEVGDARCRVDLAAWRAEGQIAAVLSDGSLMVAGLKGRPPGWASEGLLRFATGAAAGVTVRVAVHLEEGSGTRLSLRANRQVTPAAGDRFTVTAGCDKRFATCRDRFGNHSNFRGFPHLPGNDAGYAYVTEGGVFDGGPLVP